MSLGAKRLGVRWASTVLVRVLPPQSPRGGDARGGEGVPPNMYYIDRSVIDRF
jgi:hypothetical protein